MKKKQLLAIFTAFILGASTFALVACKKNNGGNTPGGDTPGGEEPGGDTPGDNPGGDNPVIVYGLPTAGTGRYIKDADVLDDGAERWLIYTTNETAGEEDNVIAVRKGTFTEGEDKGWSYSDEQIAISGEIGGWDEYVASASLVKGTFTYEEESYGWLMAYAATDKANNTQYQIGLAVAETPNGTWTKVGEAPIVEFDYVALGQAATSVGCYAPSLVNYNKTSGIRLFYTYADSLGHFAKFVDLDASNLSATTVAGNDAYVPNNGAIDGGDTVNMFPNADFAYDATNETFYAVKDYSPTPTQKPTVSRKLQLLSIAEAELYTTDISNGWQNIKKWDNTDTPDGMWERLYSACIVSDEYGHVDGATGAEIIYNVSDIQANTDNYLFTQNLMTFTVTYTA